MGKQKLIILLVLLPVAILIFLNLLLVFTPEMGFDALWYHLTLPKLWLLKHQWYFSGGLLYYSSMPRLAETLFMPLINLTGTIGPKFLQYSAGLGTGFLIWKILSELKQPKLMKAVGVSLFYCTWLVSWQSGSAYIDLIRTFLEVSALYFLLKGSWKIGGVFLGLAIGTKWLSLGSLAIYSVIFGPQIIFPALLIASPWFAIAYYFTGNPVYPIFGGVTDNSFSSLFSSVQHLLLTPWYLTKPFDDFLSPLAGVLFILALLSLRQQNKIIKRIALVGIFGSLLTMTINPPSSRYLLPYFPALVIASVSYIGSLKEYLQKLFVFLVILSGFVIVGLRLIATQKYLPYLTGKVNRDEFLSSQYHRLPGTFVDTDGFVSALPEGSKILVDRLHNLYYFPRDFDHTSWTNSYSDYDYLVTKGETLGKVEGELVHTNNLGIQIFKLKND